MASKQEVQQEILKFSEALVTAQKPIRLLNAVRIAGETFEKYKQNGFSAIGPFTPEFYEQNQIKFDTAQKKQEFLDILNAAQKSKRIFPELLNVFSSIVDSYLLALDMIELRGTKKFGEVSKSAYGEPNFILEGASKTLFEFSSELMLSINSSDPDDVRSHSSTVRTVLKNELTAQEMTEELFRRLNPYFNGEIKVVLSDGIISDAAAGGDQIKIRQEAMFNPSDVEVFEVHEGWVHVGTTLNGRLQPHCKWLSVGPPRSACTQEGLAVMMEVIEFRSTQKRMNKIHNRMQTIKFALDGANFDEVYRWNIGQGIDELESFKNTVRVFRGTTGAGGGAFTKDISYVRGLIENYNFLIESADETDKWNSVWLLFSGKVAIADMPAIKLLFEEGILETPKYVPKVFKDSGHLKQWLDKSSYLAKIKI